MLELGFFGEEINLLVTQRCKFGPISVTTTNPDTTPVDFTGATIQGQIRSTFGKHLCNIDVTITNAALGQYEFSISESNAAKLPAGVDIDSPESTHVWDLEIVDSSGISRPLYYGKVSVRKKVTNL